MSDPIVIDPRFHGPPSSGNGGYSCGRLAAYAGGVCAVRLKVPPPLSTPMNVVREGDVVRLMHGDQVVAEARPTTIDFEPPARPTFDEAAAASRNYRGFHDHWYPACFVCGPDRAEGDGLRVFPGPVPGRNLVACPWTPDASLGDEKGDLRPEFIWAALDCPGAFAFEAPKSGSILLGELAVSIRGTVRVGEPCVLVGWELGHEGRKHIVGTALYGEAGDCRGLGRGIWIEIAQAAP